MLNKLILMGKTLLYILIFSIGIVIGYKIAMPVEKVATVDIKKQDPIKQEVIKTVDRTDAKEVEKYFNSKINITRDYKINDSDSSISCVIVASNGFMQSTATDVIKYNNKPYETPYQTYALIGVSAFTLAVLTTLYITKTDVKIPLMNMRLN